MKARGLQAEKPTRQRRRMSCELRDDHYGADRDHRQAEEIEPTGGCCCDRSDRGDDSACDQGHALGALTRGLDQPGRRCRHDQRGCPPDEQRIAARVEREVDQIDVGGTQPTRWPAPRQ